MTRGTKGLGVAIGCLALALVVTACAGSKSKTASTASSAPAVSPSVSAAPSGAPASGGARNTAAFAAYTACLAQHGVTLPSFSRGPRPSGSFSRPPGGFSRPPGASRGPGGDGGFGFGGSADPSTAAARAACASLLPTGAFGGGRTISATTFAAFKSCMSDNGVTITVTDPTQAIRSLNRSDAKTAAALKICQPILGTQGAQGSGAPSPAPAASS